MDGLATPGKIVNGADLSFNQVGQARYLDAYGHGTHMAGIIAGRSNGAPVELSRRTCCFLLGAGGFLGNLDPFDLEPAANLSTVGFSVTTALALAMQPGTGVMFASSGGALGTIDTATGAFHSIGSFGSARGAAGTKTLTAVSALTFHNATLYAVDFMGLGKLDLLLKVNPLTGGVVQNGSGPGVDYVQIQKLSKTLTSLSDIAVDPATGMMYGLAWDGNGHYELATVNPATGLVSLVGGKLSAKVSALTFDGYGQLWGLDAVSSQLVVIDKATGAAPQSTRSISTATAYRDIAPTTADVFLSPAPYFLGMAPGARIVNVKVGAHDGAVDVSQVIAAIDWVVQHRTDHGLNIRVLNLSLGTDSVQKYEVDPLAYAVEQAWKRGIVVVVAAGNNGNGSALRDPATDPFVIAVGSVDPQGTHSTGDDVLSPFSNCGVGRTVDLVAPGRSILSLRSPGSTSDVAYPEARLGTHLFRGTGTSQAAAVVSGAVALLLDQRPGLLPDQVKSILRSSARPIAGVTSSCQGAGLLDLGRAPTTLTPTSGYAQGFKVARGTGLLDAARGTHRVSDGVAVISGEIDIHGKPWNGTTWSAAAAQGTTWSGGTWNGTTWSGTTWSGANWLGTTWSGTTWSETTWSWTTRSGTTWSGTTWSGTTWSGTTWSDRSWRGQTWG